MYSYDLQPWVITVEGKSNKEPQEDDTCSQAMTAKGWTRPSALNSTDSGIKNKNDRQECRAQDSWRQTTRQVLDQARATGHEKNTVSSMDEVSECESMDWEQSVVIKKQ